MHWVRLFLFIYSHWDGLTLNTMSRGSSFSWSHAQESFVKKAHWLLLNLQIRLLWIIIYLTVSSGNLDNAFCMCAIFLFIHFFMPTIKSLKASLVNEFYIWIEMRLAFCCCVHNKAKVLLAYFCTQSPFIPSLMNFSFLFMHISRLYYERMNEWDKKIDDTS